MFAKLGAAYETDGLLFMSLCPGQVKTSENPDSCKLGEPMTQRWCYSRTNSESISYGFTVRR